MEWVVWLDEVEGKCRLRLTLVVMIVSLFLFSKIFHLFVKFNVPNGFSVVLISPQLLCLRPCRQCGHTVTSFDHSTDNKTLTILFSLIRRLFHCIGLVPCTMHSVRTKRVGSTMRKANLYKVETHKSSFIQNSGCHICFKCFLFNSKRGVAFWL